jgi:hypothetical protein
MSMLQGHLRFVEVAGEDYREVLQDRWESLMDAPTDYFAEQIVSMARRMMDRELREDDLVWQKAYR